LPGGVILLGLFAEEGRGLVEGAELAAGGDAEGEAGEHRRSGRADS
jgi:hypothetical protein